MFGMHPMHAEAKVFIARGPSPSRWYHALTTGSPTPTVPPNSVFKWASLSESQIIPSNFSLQAGTTSSCSSKNDRRSPSVVPLTLSPCRRVWLHTTIPSSQCFEAMRKQADPYAYHEIRLKWWYSSVTGPFCCTRK